MRKCVMMVPRDEDGEKLARKRAKQRTILPPMIMMPSQAHDPFAPRPVDLALALGSPTPSVGSPTSLSHSSSFRVPGSPRSDSSSPELRTAAPAAASAQPAYGADEAARAQALSEQSLFALALDDDHSASKSALTSAMLFSAIQTPAASPQHPGARHATSADDKEGGGTTPGSKRQLELDGDDGAHYAPHFATSARPPRPPSAAEAAQAAKLSAAFTAHIAAKLELDEPPKPPRLDELHEEFLLLNAEHRCSIRHDNYEADSRVPILAF